MILTNSGVLKLMQRIKSYIASQLNTKAPSVHTHTISEIDDLSTLSMGGGYSKSEVDTLLNGKADTSHTHTKSDITDLPNGLTVDSTLDETSSNAIANSAVKNALDGYVPKAGGAVMTGELIARSTDGGELTLAGGTSHFNGGATIEIFSTGYPNYGLTGAIRIGIQSYAHNMYMYANGSWIWDGTAIQYISDQRLKQQITEIDDKLLDAWEDVTLCQFKYNDAVDQKGDNARLHTGYVVQQIDDACKSHNVDISQYGLYCHEEYPEETEEVEVEQKDGTKKTERKVIREASEHYSLRYTETLVVECAYLRRENTRLKQQMQQYSESLSKLEERLKALEQTSK